MDIDSRSGMALTLDDRSGLPTAIRFGDQTVFFTAGDELPLAYLLLARPASIVDNTYYSAYKAERHPLAGSIQAVATTYHVDGERHVVSLQAGSFTLHHAYRFYPRTDRLTYSLSLENTGDGPVQFLGLAVVLPTVRTSVEARQRKRYHESLDVYEWDDLTLLAFAHGIQEYILLSPMDADKAPHFDVEFLPAGVINPGEHWEAGAEITFVLARTDDPPVEQRIKELFIERGLASAAGNASWIAHAAIYETFIGLWPIHHDGRTHSHYSKVADLIDDLPRLHEVGYDTIYLMPAHPYPAYSVLDLHNMDAQYGDGEPGGIKALCDAAHARGMRVIVDMIMHGVLDSAAVNRMNTILESIDPLENSDLYVYFALHTPYWEPQVPDVHPYYVEHPEWFSHALDGGPLFSYTRAFDLGHPGFQRFFIDAHLAMIREYDIDGFRVDAPNWNLFLHGWSRAGSARPSHSSLAADRILRRLHQEARAIKPDVGFLVETILPEYQGSGHSAYSYDYCLVLEDLASGELTGRQAAALFQGLAAMRLPGVKTTYFTDSHDTFWWHFTGERWWHERYPLPLVKAAMAVICLCEGAVMHFDGGDPAVRAWMKTLLTLRRATPVLHSGAGEIQLVNDPHIFAVRRLDASTEACVVISFTGEPTTFTLELTGDRLAGDWSALKPLLGAATAFTQAGSKLDITLPPYGVEVFLRERSVTY